MDFKVFDESKTEVDEEVFEFLLQRPDLGVLEICVPRTSSPDGELFGTKLFIHSNVSHACLYLKIFFLPSFKATIIDLIHIFKTKYDHLISECH